MDKVKETTQLFSLDIESYINKTAVFSQRSELLYPAELVKIALDRGADQLDLIIDPKKVEISDNGRGIDHKDLKMLVDLRNDEIPVEMKERAVSRLKGEHGAGLLSVFASGPKIIRIENVTSGSKSSIEMSENGVISEEDCPIKTGTKISIFRPGGSYKREIKILREYCKWVRCRISVNGESIVPEKNIPDTLITARIDLITHGITGICGVPESGGICKIWLTGNGVIRKKIEIPPVRGLLFSAVLETEKEEWDEIAEEIIPYIYKLYLFLAENYPKLSLIHKDRVEELVFSHSRKTGELKFVNTFRPFRTYGNGSYLGLEELKKLANSGKLYVVNSKSVKENRLKDHSALIVELSPRQIDFVLNYLKISAKFIDTVGISYRNRKGRILLRLQSLKDLIFARLRIFGTKVVNSDQLWNEEKHLLSRLNNYFRDDWELLKRGYQETEFFMVKGPGFAPLYFSKSDDDILKNRLEVRLRRGSKIVKRIIKLTDQDDRNFEIAVAFIRTEIEVSRG